MNKLINQRDEKGKRQGYWIELILNEWHGYYINDVERGMWKAYEKSIDVESDNPVKLIYFL